MMEGQLILSMILRSYRIELVEGREPIPVAPLTVRGATGFGFGFDKEVRQGADRAQCYCLYRV